MKKDISRLISLSIVAVLVVAVGYSCGTKGTTPPPSSLAVSMSFSPTSGTIGAVDLNSVFYENISTSIGTTVGVIDPKSIKVSIKPAVNFSPTVGFSSGAFAGYVDIVPDGFLTAGTTYSVTTQFTTVINKTTYPVTRYNTFTTVASAGTNSVIKGNSFFVVITGVSQPPVLASVLAGNIPNIAMSVVTETTSPGNPFNADGSMILYGGEAVGNGSSTDIKATGFTLPLVTMYKGKYFRSSGSITFDVSGIHIPLKLFNLSGTFSNGNIINGTLYAEVHCTDPQCSNLGPTAAPIVTNLVDSNGNIVLLGTFTATANAVPSVKWI